MGDVNSNVVVLAEHAKALSAWDADHVQQLLKEYRLNLQILDSRLETLNGHNKPKQQRILRSHASKTQRQLDKISDWLDDELEKDGIKQEGLKKLQETCKKLIDRSERFKKTIADDMSDSRNEENKWRLNPLQAFSALAGIIGGAVGLAKGQNETHQNFIFGVGTTLVSAGIYAAFRQSINEAFYAAGQATVKASMKVTALRKDIRSSAFAVTLYASALATEKNDIAPRYPSQNTTRAKIIMAAKY